jgi:hypothetical protein
MTWQKGCIYHKNITRPCKISLTHCYTGIIHQHPLSSLSVFSLQDEMYICSVCIDSILCVSTKCISKSIFEHPVSMISFSPVNIWTNTHCSPAEGNSVDDNGHAVEPAIAQVCNRYMWHKVKYDSTTVSHLAD